MFNKYAKEFEKNKKYLYRERFKEMFDFLEKLYDFNNK